MDFPLRHFQSAESLYSDDSDAGHAVKTPTRHPGRSGARAGHIQAPAKSHRRYQSEEEAPSSVEEEEAEEYQDYSELSGQSETEASQDEITIDPTIDLNALEVLQYETAKRVTILCSGRAAEIHIGRPAPRRRGALVGRTESPIQKVAVPRRSSRRRQRSISLYDPTAEALGCAYTTTPTQASFDSSRSSSVSRSRSRSAARSSSDIRSSSAARSVTNFSAPHRNPNRPRPSRLVSNQSTSSFGSVGATLPSLSHGPESPAESELPHDDEDDGDAVMRESLEVQVRTRSAERTRQMALSGADTAHYSDEELEAIPKMPPTSYDAYDPYGLEPPQLGSDGRRGSAVATVARRWKGLARVGRRGRRDATVGLGDGGW